MAKPNYAFAKRQRDLAKKAKKEEKRLRKAQAGAGGGGPDTQEGQPEESQAVPGATEVAGSGEEAADEDAIAPGGVEGAGPDRLEGGSEQPDPAGAVDRRNA